MEKSMVILDMDEEDMKKEIKLEMGEIVKSIIGGDEILVEKEEIGKGIEDSKMMEMNGKEMWRRNERREREEKGNVNESLGWEGKRVVESGNKNIGGVELKMEDIKRIELRKIEKKEIIEESLGREEEGENEEKNVLGKNGNGRERRVEWIDMKDEKRNIDESREGVNERRVIKEIKEVDLENGLMRWERWMKVVEEMRIIERRKKREENVWREWINGRN